MLEGPFCIWDFGYGKNAPKNINEYLGRKVVFYDKVYTVVHVEPSDRQVYRVDGSVIPGAASLFMARWQGRDGQPEGMGANAATIAEPCKTICHWHPDVDFREDAEECARLYKAALAGNEARKQQAAEEKLRVTELRNAREARFRELCPEWAKAYIVAVHQQNESDIMTDYFSASETRVVLLGFSKSIRENFSEMRKLAAKFPFVAHLSEEGEEHREKYTGGHGYYLAGRGGWYSGWIIRKENFGRDGRPAWHREGVELESYIESLS